MYGVVREYQAPTGVTHAVRGRFGNGAAAWGVVFARKTCIELYVVRASADTARFELVQSTQIGATVMSLAVLRRTSAPSDVLWIGFDKMRMIALTWDANTRSWILEQTVNVGSMLGLKLCSTSDMMTSMDFADPGRKLLRGKTGGDAHPLIRADPSGRCIAVLGISHDIVYIIPTNMADESVTGHMANSDDVFLIDLKASYNATNVKDIVFLQGTFEPNIVVLCEPKRTWSGRAAVHRNTSHLLSVSIDVRSKRHAKTWLMEKLPHDSLKLEPVPESAEGGVLLLAPNVIMQVRHGACVAGLSLNCFGDAYAVELKGTYDAIRASETLMALDAGHCRFVDWEETGVSGGSQNTALLSLKGGELYFLTLATGANNSLELQRAGSTVLASEIVPVNERFFVLASRLSDSLLVEYQRSASDVTNAQSSIRPMKASAADVTLSKSGVDGESVDDDAELEIYGTKSSLKSEDETDKGENSGNGTLELVEKDEGTRGVYDDEDELGWVFNMSIEDEKASKASIRAGKWALKVKDTLPCFGPGMDLTVGLCPRTTDNGILDMVIAGGYAKNGCLAVIHQSVRPMDNFEFEFKGCNEVWTLRDPTVSRRKVTERKARNKAIVTCNEAVRARNTEREVSRKQFIDDYIAKYVKDQQKERLKKTEEEDQGVMNGNTPENTDKITDSSVDTLEKKRKAEDDESEPIQNAKRLKNEGGASTVANTVEPDTEIVQPAPENIEVPSEILDQAEATAAADDRFQLEVEESIEEDIADEESLHAYMLLSTNANTVILSTGSNEFEQVIDKSVQFVTDEQTIHAGNILRERASIQITKSRIRVLMDGIMQCEYFRPADAPYIVHAQVLDPQVLLLTADGRCSVFTVKAEPFEMLKDIAKQTEMNNVVDEHGNKHIMRANLKTFPIHLDFESPKPSGSTEFVNCACLYRGILGAETVKDASSVIHDNHEDPAQNNVGIGSGKTSGQSLTENLKPKVKEEPKSANGKNRTDLDEEDRMLYGDDIDDEEELMLYGDAKDSSAKTEEIPVRSTSSRALKEQKQKDVAADPTNNSLDRRTTVNEIRPAEKGVLSFNEVGSNAEDLLLVIATKSGALELRAPALEFDVVLRCDHFFAAPSVVNDSSNKSGKLEDKLRAPKKYRIKKIFVNEVQMSPELPGLSTPILVAITESGLPLIYTGYMSQSHMSKFSTRMRSRLHFRRITSTDRSTSIFARSITEVQALNSDPSRIGSVRFSVTPFTNVAGRSGLFVSGPVPFFIFAERGFPRVHALYKNNKSTERNQASQRIALLSFAELDLVNCRSGFVSVASNGIIRIGELPPSTLFNFDSPSPMRKIALRCTPHKVAYHAGSATYGVLASMPTLTTREERLARILQSLEKHDKRHYQHTAAQAEAETGDSSKNRVPPLFEELHELRVYRADSWELIKSYKLEKGEVGLAIANMNVNVFKQRLASSGFDIPSSHRGEDGNESLFAASLKLRPKNMLVVGTGFVNGEDATSRGRLLLFEVSRQEICMANDVHTAFQLQLVAEKEFPSPVTAVASMEGYVICGVGPQVSVYKLVGDEIVHLSFAFGQLFCTSISTLKQYVVTGDIRKSVSFMYFRDRNSSVNFLGKDYEHVTTYATEFLVRNDEMSIILSDGKGNLHALNYVHASVPESRGGKRLLANGGIAYGSQINKFVRVCDLSDTRIESFRETYIGGAGRHALAFATLDGGIGMVIAVSKPHFDMVQALADAMEDSKEIARYSGIEPDLVRKFSPESTSTELLSQRLVDSRSAFHLFSLNLLAARKVATQLSTDVAKIAGMMTELDSVIQTFG